MVLVSSFNGHFNGYFDFVKRAVRLHFYFLIAFELPKAAFGALLVKKQKNGIRFCNSVSGNDQLEVPVVRQFQEDWSSFIIVEVDNRLNETIHKVNANSWPARFLCHPPGIGPHHRFSGRGQLFLCLLQ